VTASNAHVLLKRGRQAALDANKQSSGSNFWSKRGLILEVEAIEIYEAVTGKKVERVGFVTNSDYPNCGYSPDGWNPLLESKSFAKEKHLSCMKELPLEVYCQIQFGMMIAGKNSIDVILYNPDIEDSNLCFKIIKVKKDARLVKRFQEKIGAHNGKETTATV
jgi:hypothetical protein